MLWIYFSYIFIEREVLLQTYRSLLTSLLESEVKSLLLDTINDWSLGTLKVDTFSVGSIISDVYKISTTNFFWSARNESWVCELWSCSTDAYHCGGNSRKLRFWP